MRNLDPKRARWIRLRMGVLSGVMGLGLGGFVSSAYRVQVEDGAAGRETAEKQRQRRLHVEPKRGTIFDRNGTALAVSVEVPSISADVVEMLRGVDGAPNQGEGHRYSPGRELAGPVLGFVAPDGQGKDGLELALDEELRGHVEEVKGLRDRSGRLIFSQG